MTNLQTFDPRLTGGDHPLTGGPRDPGRCALAHALAMRFDDADECFRWLYDYGAEPMTPVRVQRADSAAPVLSGPMRAVLGCHFAYRRSGVWDVWSRRDSADAPVWKAYLNPRFKDLPSFALRIGSRLVHRRVSAFKMVAQRWMALRSDKVIVYFHCSADRAAWIDAVLPDLSGIAANPVPFTTRHDVRGLVTVATDPIDTPGQSWRSQILRHIASKIVQPQPPAIFELEADLRRSGVDPTTWEKLDGSHD